MSFDPYERRRCAYAIGILGPRGRVRRARFARTRVQTRRDRYNRRRLVVAEWRECDYATVLSLNCSKIKQTQMANHRDLLISWPRINALRAYETYRPGKKHFRRYQRVI